MEEDEISTGSELEGSPLPKKKKKKTRWWSVLIDVLLVTLFVGVLAVSGDVIYLTTAYGDAFFVDGMSMYPTLNKDGFRLGSDGNYAPLTWYSGENQANDIVDYGWGRMNEKGLSDLKRYDIVITYYPGSTHDGTVDAEGNFTKSANASMKIKRLIGLPGETVTFAYDENNTIKGGSVWGKTTVKKADGTFEVLDNLYDASDFPTLSNGRAYYLNPIAARARTWTLKSKEGGDAYDEYFVMGDNRAHSTDSREVGPIPRSCLQGKAYLITSRRKLVRQDDGTFKPKFMLKYVRMPWNYKKLG